MRDVPTEPINLREARLRLGLSARVAAQRIGESVTEDVLLWAERTKRRPSPSNAVAIANFYGFDVIVQWPLDETDEVAA